MTLDNLNKSYKIKVISWKKKMKKFKVYLMTNKNLLKNWQKLKRNINKKKVPVKEIRRNWKILN